DNLGEQIALVACRRGIRRFVVDINAQKPDCDDNDVAISTHLHCGGQMGERMWMPDSYKYIARSRFHLPQVDIAGHGDLERTLLNSDWRRRASTPCRKRYAKPGDQT